MNYPCSGGDPVTMTGTSIQKGHFTLIDPRHFRVQGSNTSEYRADFPDGRYALGNETDHFSFGFGADLAAGTDTSAQQENATLYAADGQAIARSPSV